MKRDNKKGKFFVFEGIDGCGKATQANLLADFLKREGFSVEKIDFPQHGQRSSALVDDYLNGKYGGSEDVGPYTASIFYAVDRYDASFKIRKWLNEGKMVISDRYIVSNIGHQGGKLIGSKRKWKKYVSWLYDLEYGIFGIPRPDHTFILKTSVDLSLGMAHNVTNKEKQNRREAYLGSSKKQDIHEKDKSHLSNALRSYLLVAKEFPKDFKVIECLSGGGMLSPEIISEKIIKIVKGKI